MQDPETFAVTIEYSNGIDPYFFVGPLQLPRQSGRFRGAWMATDYLVADTVRYDGSLYYRTAAGASVDFEDELDGGLWELELQGVPTDVVAPMILNTTKAGAMSDGVICRSARRLPCRCRPPSLFRSISRRHLAPWQASESS